MQTGIFTPHELRILKRLSTPLKIQDFLDMLSINFELGGETCMSPRRVLREKTAHCMEGAMLAALALRFHGGKALVMDLKCAGSDDDHIVVPFRQYGRWGALSKTNHAASRFREPIYKSIRELATSYFHEYTTEDGKKILRSYSAPINLGRFDARGWMTSEKNVYYIPRYIDSVKHFTLVPRAAVKTLRRADPIEIAAGTITEWSRKGQQLFKKSKKR